MSANLHHVCIRSVISRQPHIEQAQLLQAPSHEADQLLLDDEALLANDEEAAADWDVEWVPEEEELEEDDDFEEVHSCTTQLNPCSAPCWHFTLVKATRNGAGVIGRPFTTPDMFHLMWRRKAKGRPRASGCLRRCGASTPRGSLCRQATAAAVA